MINSVAVIRMSRGKRRERVFLALHSIMTPVVYQKGTRKLESIPFCPKPATEASFLLFLCGKATNVGSTAAQLLLRL